MAVSPETSSQNGDVGGYRLRRFMLKMSISPETSSKNRDLEIGREIRRSPKMGLSPETSSKKWDVRRALLVFIFGAISEHLQDGPRSEIIEKPNGFQHFS